MTKTAVLSLIKKVCGFKMNERWLSVLMLGVMLVLLAPLFRLALYAVPYYDDYLHVAFPKSFLTEYGGLQGWWDGVLYTVKTQYYAWQGTYSTQFIVSASPLILDDKFYSYAVLVVFALFVISVIVAIKMLTKRLLGMSCGAAWFMAAVVTITLVEFIHTAQQGIYWYNGEVHYTLMHGLMLLAIAIAVEILYAKSFRSALLLSLPVAVLGVIVAGSNFVTILQGLLVLLTIIGLGVLKKNKNTWFLAMPTILYTIGFYINVTAPGNAKRGAHYQGCGVVESILLSFKSGFEQFWNFTGWPLLIMMLLIVPMVWNGIKKAEYDFRFPGLVTLYSVCLYATGFTSSYYGMGTPGLGRTWVVVKFTLQLLMFLNEIYWIGWFVKRKQKKGEIQSMQHYLLYYGVLGLMMLGVFALSDRQAADFSTYGAYYYVHTGEAYNFYQEYQNRVNAIENGGPEVALEPYFWKPSFLCIGDLSTDPNAAQNKSVADWYGKEAVYIIEK